MLPPGISVSYSTGFDLLHDCDIPEGMAMLHVCRMNSHEPLDGDDAYFPSVDSAQQYMLEQGYVIPWASTDSFKRYLADMIERRGRDRAIAECQGEGVTLESLGM